MGKFVLTAELKLQAPGNINSVVNQINSRLKDIQINFKLQDAGKAVSGLNDVSKAADRATNSVDKMGYAFGVSLKRFAAFSIASRAIGLFSNRLAGAIDDAINFQDQMVRLSQITGETTKDLRYISDEIGGLATKFGITSKAILSATDILAQAGLQAKDLRVAINALAKTELAPTFGKIEDTAEGAVAILAQFGEGVGALERQLGSINRVAAQFAVESEDLISVIRRTGGVFKASGGSLEELLAVFTSVRATTRESAESIATGLRTIFTRIQRPETIQYLKQFGVELTDLNGKFVGPFDAVKKLSEALSQFGEGDIRFIAIAEELGGYRQIGKVIPLIRQFSLAEQARQVAVEGGASLDEDAAKSQESLRRQFIRTQESFLKLIRDIGDTTSFQTMVKVGLNLANAFIKVADSIKPIIPLIGALAAIKFAQGIGNFAAGIGAGFRQVVGPRAKNAGGKIHAFARGGLVPGSGNRDTVPAMLSPGEFVIRKSSVNKIGVGQLAAMNENRYANGGFVRQYNNGTSGKGIAAPTDEEIALYESLGSASGIKKFLPSGATKNNLLRNAATFNYGIFKSTLKKAQEAKEQAKLGRKAGEDPNSVISGAILNSRYGVSFLEGALSGDFGATINQVIKSGNATGVKILQEAINKDGRRLLPGAKIQSPNASVAFLTPQAKQIFDNEIVDGLPKLFDKATSKFNAPLKPGEVNINQLLSNSAVQAVKGYFFEAFARRISQNLITDSLQDKTDPIFDFTGAGNVPDLKRMFGGKFANPNEFKVKPTTENIANAISKAIAFRGIDALQLFANGGSVAKQKFAKGTSGKGVPLIDDILQNAPGTAILPVPSKAIQSIIDAGGAALDVDRTLIRTVGDTAYAKAKTPEAKNEVLARYFRDPAARMRDITTSPITQFGQELIRAVTSGVVNPKTLSIISKSSAVPGIKRYIRGKFGIPESNMQFTSGANKVPFLQKASTVGPQIAKTKKFATGGPAPSDTVPALLTPGEFVINKSSAQRIGYGNLNKMNKQGVAGFAKGGSVGVQKFADGGTPKYKFKSGRASDETLGQIGQIKTAFKKYKDLGVSNANALALATSEIKNMTEQTKLYIKAETKRIDTTNKSVKNIEKANKTAEDNTKVNQPEKDANASFVKFAAFTGAVNTVGTSLIEMGKNADGTSTAFSRIAEASLGVVNQVSAVIFALQQFGVSLNAKGLKEFFGGGKGSLGDKLTGGRFAGSMQSKGPGFISKAVGRITQPIGGAIKNTGAVLNRIPGVSKATSFIGGGAAKVGGVAKTAGMGAISNIGGVLAKVAGPLAAIGGSALLVSGAFNSVISAAYDYENQIKAAVEAGNAEKAAELAGKQSDLQAANTLRTVGAGAGAVLGAALGPVGSFVGAIAGAAIATGLAAAFPEFAQGVSEFFGGDTKKSVMERARADGLAAKYTLEHAANLKEADAATQQWQAGLISTEQAMMVWGKNARNAAAAFSAEQSAVAESQANKSTGFQANLRNVFSLGGTLFENSTARNTRIDKENAARSKESFKGLSTEFEGLMSGPLAKNLFATGKSGQEVMDAMAKMNPEIFAAMNQAANSSDEALSKMGKQALETAKRNAEASAKQAENQRKYLETLNLGLFNVVSGAQAAASALELIAMQGEGVDPLTKSMKVLEAAVTSQAGAMDPKQIETATQEYANSLRQAGLAESDVQKNVSALQATTQVQAGLGTSLTAARSKLQKSAAGGNPEEIRNALVEAATNNITDEQQRTTISARLKNINLDDQKIIAQLFGGDVSGILKAASEQLTEATKEQIEAGNLLAKNNQALSAMVMKRIEAEKQAADAANEAVDVGLEMAKVREQFGGPKVTMAQQRQASAQRTANILRGTGISGGAGTPQDLSRAGQQIQQELLALERKKAAGAFTDVDKQRETQLLQASAGVTDQKKKELELAKESAEVTKRKVSMEKSAFEKLLGGDVMGAIEDMMASSAAAALRSGDAGLAGAFGGKALLGGLKNLEEAGASAEQKQAAARAAGASFGIGPRLADAFAGTTREEMAANQQVAAATYAVEQGAKESADLAQARTDTAVAFEEQARAAVKRPPGTPISFGGTVPLSAPEKTTAGAPVVAPGALGGATAGGAGSTSQRTGAATGTPTGAPTIGAGISPEVIASFGTSVSNFVAAVDKLQNLKLSVQIDATNVNVNLNGGTFLNTLSTEVRNTVLDAVAQEIPKYKVGPDGKLTKGGIVG